MTSHVRAIMIETASHVLGEQSDYRCIYRLMKMIKWGKEQPPGTNMHLPEEPWSHDLHMIKLNPLKNTLKEISRVSILDEVGIAEVVCGNKKLLIQESPTVAMFANGTAGAGLMDGSETGTELRRNRNFSQKCKKKHNLQMQFN